MEQALVLKAIADETRMSILRLLLAHNYCVRALARKLDISEAAISQHLRVLREAGLLIGEKKGYFRHYDVDRNLLHELADSIAILATIERETCTQKLGGCKSGEFANCHNSKGNDAQEVKEFCHGAERPHHPAGQSCQCNHHQRGGV